MIRASELDKRLTFEVRQETTDPVYGTKAITWAPFKKVAAQVRELLPSRSEGVEDNISMARGPCRIKIRYRDDLNGTMRIDYRGRKLRIISGPVREDRDALILVAEELSTEGDAP